MPTYAYRGTDCTHEFEIRQSFSDNPLAECMECGKPVRRVIHPTGIVFKGSGWYVTDSRKGGSDTGDAKNPAPSSTKDANADPPSKTTSNEKSAPHEPAAATAAKG